MHMAHSRFRATARLASTLFFLAALSIGIAWADTPGKRLASPKGIPESTADIMQRQAASPARRPHPEHELKYPDRGNLPQNPNAPAVASFPPIPSEKAFPL